MTTDQWQQWIDAAWRAGWRVKPDALGGYTVVSPAAPRRPSLELGHYADERAALRGAANMARMRG